MYVSVGLSGKDGQTDLMRVAGQSADESTSINSLLCEIVCRSGFASLYNIVFVVRIRNTKPWNHFHMCTVVL